MRRATCSRRPGPTASSGSDPGTASGRWSSTARPPTCFAWPSAADGTVYAGSDGEGLIYRVNRDGKVSVVYDAPQAEVRTLLIAPDGALYAGTAAEAGGGGASRSPGLFSQAGDEPEPRRAACHAGGPGEPGPPHPARRPLAGRPSPGPPWQAPPRPSRCRRATTPSTGSTRTAWPGRCSGPGPSSSRSAGRAIACYVGTGPDGQLYEVRDRGGESTPLAKLDHGQILSLLAEPSGESSWGPETPARSSGSPPASSARASWSRRSTTPSS